MKIRIKLWDIYQCINLTPSILLCSDFGNPWWDINRIHIRFIHSEITVLFNVRL